MKKAQIKFGETIAILFIFFFLLVIGIIFYVRIKSVSVGREITEMKDVRAVELSQNIAFLPEFQCTEMNVVEASCFDILKISAMEKVYNNHLGYYSREFGSIKIEVEQLFPPGEILIPYDNTPDNYTQASLSQIPVALYNATSKKYSFGVLRVTAYG